MAFDYNDKGKFFTDVITKTPVPALVQTTTHLIKGIVHVRRDERIKDELGRPEVFLAMTEASVIDESGKALYENDFIAIHKSQIVWVIPDEEDIQEEKLP